MQYLSIPAGITIGLASQKAFYELANLKKGAILEKSGLAGFCGAPVLFGVGATIAHYMGNPNASKMCFSAFASTGIATSILFCTDLRAKDIYTLEALKNLMGIS